MIKHPLLYSRLMVGWIGVGMVLLNGFLLYKLFSTPFQFVHLTLGWLFLGLDVIIFTVLVNLWDTDLEVW